MNASVTILTDVILNVHLGLIKISFLSSGSVCILERLFKTNTWLCGARLWATAQLHLYT